MDKPNRNPKPFIERLGELMQIQRELRFGQPGCNHCVDFLTVMQRIDELSFGTHQWTALPVTDLHFRNKKWSRRYLIVCYANPDSTGLPNHLCFALPLLIGRIGAEGPRTLLACFAPESIVPLSKGLYWEDDDLKEATLGDYLLFWEPLKQCLWAQEAERHPMKQKLNRATELAEFVYCSKAWHLKYLDGAEVSPVARELQAEANAWHIEQGKEERCDGMRQEHPRTRQAYHVLRHRPPGHKPS